jgi:hypothetical protein
VRVTSLLLALTRAVVRAASFLVPREDRPRWIQEWDAELTHRVIVNGAGEVDTRVALRLLRRSAGALPHALWHLREAWRWDSFSQDFSPGGSRARASARLRSHHASITLAAGSAPHRASSSVIEAVLLRPLPIPEPERLVYLFEVQEDRRRTA